jgi:hypothetical protein
VVTEKNKTGSFLISNLKHKLQIIDDDFVLDTTNCTRLKIAVPEYYQRNFGIYITPRAQLRFNKFLKDDMQEKMLDFILDRKTSKKGYIHPAILKFREKYGITEDELPFKTMQKWWDREKIRISA